MAHWGDNFKGAHMLRLVAPDGTTRVFALDGPELKVGSARDADLVLDDPTVAPQHCRLFDQGGALMLVDRGAPIGTYINFERCTEPTRLIEGDRVGVGGHVLEVMPARSQVDPAQVAEQIRLAGSPWAEADERDAAFARRLAQEARAWHECGRPRRLLPSAARLAHAAELDARAPLDPPIRSWLERAATRGRRRQGARWTLSGAALGCALTAPLLAPLFTPVTTPPESPHLAAAPTPTPSESPATKPSPGPPRPDVPSVEHEVIPEETLAEIAALYGTSERLIAGRNGLAPGATLAPGTRLQIQTRLPAVVRERVGHRVEPGDSWEGLARRFGVDVSRLRAHNRELGPDLHPGQIVTIWARRDAPRRSFEPAALVVPSGSTSVGPALVHAVQIPRSRDYDLRCPLNAHASSFTAHHLLNAIARLRVRYRGQLIIGDLSRQDGGSYGPHKSHQSGRDVDVWLPHRAGSYHEDPACSACGTLWCRPDPAEVDWAATWELVRVLADTDAVRNIFLDRSLHPELRAAARTAGADEETIARTIQPRSGAPALVTHIANHTKHIHVRFRCGPDEPDCHD